MIMYPRHALREVSKNFASWRWWRNRVIVPFVIGTATRLHPSYPGYNEAIRVMDEEWDNMIILDACRADSFRHVADLETFDSVETVVSLGSHSGEWTQRNFQGKRFGDTVYVSANPHTSLFAGDSFYEIIELWETDSDEEAGVVLPKTVRNAAISANEQYPDKRLIVHFMQPHEPFIGSEFIGSYSNSDEYWAAYTDNLNYVLAFVYDCIAALDGRTIVTADHGQLHSEGLFAELGFSGHKQRLRFPGLVEVPWAVVEAPRRRVTAGKTKIAPGENIQKRLRDLGYY